MDGGDLDGGVSRAVRPVMGQPRSRKKTQRLHKKMKERDREFEIPSKIHTVTTTKIVSMNKFLNLLSLFSASMSNPKKHTIRLKWGFRNNQIDRERKTLRNISRER